MAEGQILRLITLDEARRREGERGRTSQYRDRRRDPDYPRVIRRGGRAYLIEHEHQAYVAKLIERASAGPTASAGSSR
jgi:hypothetical protein